nr:MAG TPA: TF SRF-type transcription factor [Caudoviricetes sp.]
MIPAKRPKGLFAQAAWRSLLLSPPGGLFFYSENGRR